MRIKQFMRHTRERSGHISVAGGFIVLICLLSVCYLTVVCAQGGEQVKNTGCYDKSEEIMFTEQIIIPTVDDIRANGYPKNENGETYGPDVWESLEEPDLLLVCNELGQKGYVRQSEFDGKEIMLEDAINYKPRQYTINMYLHDGITIIGTFTIGN